MFVLISFSVRFVPRVESIVRGVLLLDCRRKCLRAASQAVMSAVLHPTAGSANHAFDKQIGRVFGWSRFFPSAVDLLG